jgi:hypothetical protein
MIKNGESGIKETIDAIKQYIDYYVILDTGSTDNSIPVMQDCLKDKNGKIFEEPFQGFDISRNRLIELAEQEPHDCKYFIMLDDTYIIKNQEFLISYLEKNKKYDAFALPIITKHVNESMLYYNIRIWKPNLGIRYKDPIHEHIECSNVDYIDKNISYIYDNVDNYMRIRSMKRKEYDISILKKMHAENPKYTRALRYLIDYHYTSATKNECLDYCMKMVQLLYTENVQFLSNSSQKDFYECCIKLIKLLITYWGKSLEDVQKYIHLAQTIDPTRIDHIYYHACLLEREKKYYEMNTELKKIYRVPIPKESTKLSNMDVDLNMYNFNVPYKYIISNVYLKKYKYAIQCIKEYLDENPDDIRFKNLLYNVDLNTNTYEVTKYEGKTLVFVYDVVYAMDVPEKIFSYLSGLKRRGWKIFMFTQYESFDEKYDMTNINVRKLDTLYPFLQDTYVDVLVSFNTTKYCVYLDNIQKVYVWDYENSSISDDIFTSHSKIFKGFICQTKNVAENIKSKYSIDEYNIKHFFIPSENYTLTRDKVKNKCTIYYLFDKISNKLYIDSIVNYLKQTYNADIDFIYSEKLFEKSDKRSDCTYISHDDDMSKIVESLSSSEYYIYLSETEDCQDIFTTTAIQLNCIPITNIEEYKNLGVYIPETKRELIHKKLDLIFSNDKITKSVYDKVIQQKEKYTMKEFCKKVSQEFL